MKTFAPAFALSALLVSPHYGIDWTITDTQTKNITGQTINGVQLMRSGNLTVNSTGNSTINQMQMLFLQNGASATFNVNGGNLNLDLSIANMQRVQHQVTFDIKNNATLTLTSGTNGAGNRGIFSGIGTTLNVNIASGGKLVGSLLNDTQTNATLLGGSTMQGDIRQSAGTLSARIEGTLEGGVQIADGVRATLLANENQNPATQTATITGNITQAGGNLSARMNGLHLKGGFVQTGGESNATFKKAQFDSSITISNAATNMEFRNSTLQAISVTGFNLNTGRSDITLYGSTMGEFTGNDSNTTLSLNENSTMKSATQNQRDLTISVNKSIVDGSIVSNSAELTATFVKSQINGGVSNTGGMTTINATSTNIAESITQTRGVMYFKALEETKIGGMFNQSGGNLSRFVLDKSSIQKGVFLTEVRAVPYDRGALMKISASTIHNSMTFKNLSNTLTGEISKGSIINGGLKQFSDATRDDGKVQLTFTQSTLNGGLQVQDGNQPVANRENFEEYMGAFNFHNGSTLTGGVTSNNHSLWLDFKNSQSRDGDFTFTGGRVWVGGSNNSKIQADIVSQDTTSTNLMFSNRVLLEGNITQTNGEQHLQALQTRITGNITNHQTQTRFDMRQNSELLGEYTQTGGSLHWSLGGSSIVKKDITLHNVQTVLDNGIAQDRIETFEQNLTQNDGSLSGELTGLTLKGIFTQNRGTANITFKKANFSNPTSINQAIRSKVIFDEGSQLKDYTISDSPKNAQGEIVNLLKLDHVTILTGNFTLSHSSSKLTVINDSKITGSVISNDPDNDLELDIGSGGTIGGDIEINGGNVGGDFDGGNIGGDIKLTDANAHFHFKDSSIGGTIAITRGNTVMTLDHTNIAKGFTMTGRGDKTPSLILTIENGSSVTGDVRFDDTDVYLGGSGEGNVIEGNLISTNTNLTNTEPVQIENLHPGKEPVFPLPLSGLTITKNFEFNGGKLDLVMTNKSSVGGETIFKDSEFAHLLMDESSTLGKISISNLEDVLITLDHQSTQQADGTNGITLIDSKAVLKAFNQSSIASNILVVSNQNFPSHTEILLNAQSSLIGNIVQNSGDLFLDYRDSSTMRGNITINSLNATINLDDNRLQGSSLIGDLSSTNSIVKIDLNNHSTMKSTITSIATPKMEITLNNQSKLQGSINHTGAKKEGENDLEIKLNSGSILENTGATLIGNIDFDSLSSTINSERIDLVHGKLNIQLDNSNGTIKELGTGGTNAISILTTNYSNSSIDMLTIKDNATLALVGRNNAQISGQLVITKNASASIVSLSNALIDFDITPQDTSTLDIALNGGKLQGIITQEQPLIGKATLGTNGAFGGRWIMTGDSTLKSLVINNSSSSVIDEALMAADSTHSQISMIDMTKDRDEARVGKRVGKDMVASDVVPQDGQTRARTLRLSSLNGLNGVFRVYVDIGANLADKVSAQIALGSHIIQVVYNQKTYTENLDGKYIVVAHVDDPETTVSFAGRDLEIGTQAYQTDVKKVNAQEGNGWDWILGKTTNTGPSYSTKVIASILQSQYRAFSIQTETLNQRLGELKELKRIDGLWARYYMGINGTKETQTHIKVDDYYYSGWIGYDQNSLSLRGQNFLGFALSYALVSPNSKDYTGDIHNVGFNFYDVFVAKNDFYVDVVAKYIMSYGMYEINYYSLAKNSPKYLNHKLMASVEIGKKFKLGQKRYNYFYLQPEAQVTSGYIHGNDLSFVDLSDTTIQANLGYSFPVIMRAGLVGAYAMDYSSFKGDIRLGGSIVYEVNNGGSVRLDDGNNTVEYKYGGDFHLLLQAGANFILNESSRVYLEASTGFLGDTSTTYAVNMGVRFNFGPKNTRRLKVPSSTPPPPPPPPEYDPRNIPVITDNTKNDIRNNNEVRKPSPYNSDYFINTRKNFRDSTSLSK
ncbi:autotransporter outer membrane beta-barrel domain-containing protein [Helicobacter kayseriensis]|uniref:autotransporter outer membrane beta-barrel domain-containing protein n=1 Tax=Helicobacter kayseriensis TaxID=2905877 RepID=UPI001E496B39|nr:autotransporter outer membrane beta-barrel domain-containing protein [Helicobacter kayseriensis]MCE3047384.1 autotransporter outer membrane beta-barrel domain-containing protein [Helicobacter kayseriensis]MCE3048755.1 autotransporter outer membrane beta-barrel domain-containing protein [Helicobacter kayseriensis]